MDIIEYSFRCFIRVFILVFIDWIKWVKIYEYGLSCEIRVKVYDEEFFGYGEEI